MRPKTKRRYETNVQQANKLAWPCPISCLGPHRGSLLASDAQAHVPFWRLPGGISVWWGGLCARLRPHSIHPIALTAIFCMSSEPSYILIEWARETQDCNFMCTASHSACLWSTWHSHCWGTGLKATLPILLQDYRWSYVLVFISYLGNCIESSPRMLTVSVPERLEQERETIPWAWRWQSWDCP